ncbi:Phosphatidylinositol N-acetylglucosaminyltransferase subunit GPI1 [Pseudozyma hubeiensis]|nr:Phosphatidylinositol N-acetylglucosaminyltransferase subunit GPI1 [Pseudozyma hubeiensis]
MSHFEVTNIIPGSPEPGQTRAAGMDAKDAPADAAFDVAGIDSLLVFWPNKLVDLSHLVSAPGNDSKRQFADDASLLVGEVICGHSHEAAVIVVGQVQDFDSDSVSHKIESNRLSIVGCISHSGPSSDPRSPAAIKLQDRSIWLSMLKACSQGQPPAVESVLFTAKGLANGHANDDSATSQLASCAVNVIVYNVPNARMLQYFALEPLRLAPVSGMKLVSTASALLLPDAQLPVYSRLLAANAAPSKLENKFLQLLMLDPLHWRSFRSVSPHQGQLHRGTALRGAVELINRLQAQHARLAASTAVKNINGATNGVSYSPKTDSRPGLLTRLCSSVTLLALALQGVLQRPLYTAKEHTVMIDGVVKRRPGSKPTTFSLTSVSASARQLDVRISQLVVAPRLASRLRYLRKQQKLPIDEIAAPYIGLWNAVWLIANDIILGYAASVLLLQHRTELAQLSRSLSERYLLESVLWLLSWLENWPAGLKLNTELSLFFSDAYSSLTMAWHAQGLARILLRLESVIAAIALTGRFMGVTMVLCMVQDLVSVCTLHITIFYTLSFRTMRAFVYVLSSLFDVFRGKKRNALRGGRLDNASYELDQLLLGTLLFTLVAFLFPTVYVYYLAFGLLRFGVVAFEAGVVETCLALLNHLPLFALMLRVKDPHRLPAGVWLQKIKAPAEKDAYGDAHTLPTGRFRLRCRPLAVGDIFEGYAQHVAGLFEVPSMLLRCIFGRSLRPPPSRP